MAEETSQSTDSLRSNSGQATQDEQEGWQEVGKVSHWFGVPQVAAMKLSGNLKIGDQIKFFKSNLDQTISSMQIEKQPVEEAKTGEEVGIKIEGLEAGQKIHAGEKVLKSTN